MGLGFAAAMDGFCASKLDRVDWRREGMPPNEFMFFENTPENFDDVKRRKIGFSSAVVDQR